MRWLELDGAFNVRDLGGLPTADGRTTRFGVLLRADALDQLTPGDVAVLADGVGLRHVVDLRSGNERAERGRGALGVCPSVRYTEVEVIPEEAIARRSETKAAAFARGDDPDEIMAAGYVELLEIGAAAFRSAVEQIAADDGSPALFHCAAGKDRTGVLAALVLGLAGVERDAIVADYALTNERMIPIVRRLTGATSFEQLAERIPAFTYQASPGTMRHFLDAVGTTWGGAAGYLSSVGVTDDALDAVRHLLVAG